MYSGAELESFLIALKEINLATNNFSPETRIGEGGFGVVYRGQLSEQWQERVVAVKRLDPKGYQGKTEFFTELNFISNFQHENIIRFVGYCDEGEEMIIVYEYASNRSLDQHLQNPDKRSCLTWAIRLKICLGAAREIYYLHSDLWKENIVIHRDIKSGNILLDENLDAKICDFGLSKGSLKDQQHTQVYTKVAGTNFYLDPIYHESGILRKDSDVYSFGVVLFEMVSGMLAYNARSFGDDKPQTLINLVFDATIKVDSKIWLIRLYEIKLIIGVFMNLKNLHMNGEKVILAQQNIRVCFKTSLISKVYLMHH